MEIGTAVEWRKNEWRKKWIRGKGEGSHHIIFLTKGGIFE